MKVGRNLATCWRGLEFKRIKIKEQTKNYKAMKTTLINYRIIGTSIIGSEKTVKECRTAILSCYGTAKFEWWSEDGSRGGTATAK